MTKYIVLLFSLVGLIAFQNCSKTNFNAAEQASTVGIQDLPPGGEVSPPPVVVPFKLEAGGYQNCIITNSGILKCWGYGGNGIPNNQALGVGDGTTTQRNTPIIIDSGVTYKQSSGGALHNCAVTTSGVLKCWGWNNSGQLGNGTTTDRLSPVVIDSGVSYSQVSAGARHTCAITTSGVLKCWGYNLLGQIGDGTKVIPGQDPESANRLLPIVIDSGVSYSQVSAGEFHNCGITTAGVLKCWGLSLESGAGAGYLGDGATNGSVVPKVIDIGVTYKSIQAGSNSSCGITSAGVLKCWGSNWEYGQIGDGTNQNSLSPKVIDPGVSYAQISLQLQHTCGITTAGVLKCWGSNSHSQIGAPTTSTLVNTPVVVDSGVTYKSVSTGYFHTCAVTTAEIPKCWGRNDYGQVGDGSTTQRNLPTLVSHP